MSTGSITFVGLGAGHPAGRTAEAQEAIDNADVVFLRGMNQPGLDDLVARDNVHFAGEGLGMIEGHPDWDAIAERICAAAADQRVVVGIPGHPRFGEPLVQTTERLARQRGIETSDIPGIDILALMASALRTDTIFPGTQLMAGFEFDQAARAAPFDGGMVNIDPTTGLVVCFLFGDETPAHVSEALRTMYPPTHRVWWVQFVGQDNEDVVQTTVDALADFPPIFHASIYVPPLDSLAAPSVPATLRQVVARLRAPGGCPWDREQTTSSLRGALIEEVYEVVDAIDASDAANLAEELGDLLILIHMHAQIVTEDDRFSLDDVYRLASEKLVRRHPHVFGDAIAENADDVLGVWQRVKAEEKAGNQQVPARTDDGQPRSMPALERAKRVLLAHPLDGDSDETPANPEDRLLAAVNDIVRAGGDPEKALRTALSRHLTQ